MKNIYKYALTATLLVALSNVHAQSAEQVESELQPSTSDATPDLESDLNDSSSEIRVRQAGTTTVREFHGQGRVYRVEIEPKNTPAYILTDQDGDGNLKSSDTSIDSDVVVPEWTIGNW
jgi:hypothetical protein